MKGIIFTELVNFMEKQGGVLFADEVLEEADLDHGGGYSTVGTYRHEEALALVGIVSARTGTSVPELCETFGRFLFERFLILFPEIMQRFTDVDALLDHVGPHIHEEVRILYPGAQPPRVSTERKDGALLVHYESHRPMAHIAFGLIAQGMVHFCDARVLRWTHNSNGDRATFQLEQAA